MKKLLIGLLVVAMLLTMVACNKEEAAVDQSHTNDEASAQSSDAVSDTGSADGEIVELTFWGHQNETWNNSHREIAEKFMAENPNIKINFEFFPYDEFESKIQTALIAKSGGADIFEIWGGWGMDFAQSGSLVSMPDELANTIRSDSYAPTIGSLEYDGKLYGMPLEFNIESGGMLVNLHLLEKNGLTIPKTWDEMIESAKKATELDGDKFVVRGFDFVTPDNVPYLFLSMILSSGGQYLNEDGSFDFTTDEAKNALEVMAHYATDEHLTNIMALTGGNDMEARHLLFTDQALFVSRGPWTISEGIDSFGLEYDKDFTYAAMPWYGSKPGFAAETGWALTINGSTKVKEAAFKYIEFFYQNDILMQHNINCAQIPPKKSVAENPALIEKMPYAKDLVGILGDAQYIGFINTDVLKTAINDTFVDYCTGLYSNIDEALVDMESKINK